MSTGGAEQRTDGARVTPTIENPDKEDMNFVHRLVYARCSEQDGPRRRNKKNEKETVSGCSKLFGAFFVSSGSKENGQFARGRSNWHKVLSLSSVRFGREYRWTSWGCSTGRTPHSVQYPGIPFQTTGWRPQTYPA